MKIRRFNDLLNELKFEFLDDIYYLREYTQYHQIHHNKSCECDNCGYANFMKHDTFDIIGFCNTTIGYMCIFQCPKCGEVYRHHITPDRYDFDEFKERLGILMSLKGEPVLEDVGDIYAERKFKIAPKFSEFDLKYRRMKNTSGKEIAYKDNKVVILKNPRTLDNLGPYIRGVIDYKGNLYVEDKSTLIHHHLLNRLDRIGVIKDVQDWGNDIPTNFVTVQRQGDTNIIRIGESEDDYSYMKLFQSFLDRAKIKNPGIEFENVQVRNTPGLSPWIDDDF